MAIVATPAEIKFQHASVPLFQETRVWGGMSSTSGNGSLPETWDLGADWLACQIPVFRVSGRGCRTSWVPWSICNAHESAGPSPSRLPFLKVSHMPSLR